MTYSANFLRRATAQTTFFDSKGFMPGEGLFARDRKKGSQRAWRRAPHLAQRFRPRAGGRRRAAKEFGDSRRSIVHVQLFVHVLQVRADRAGCDAENRGDLLVGVAGGEKLEDVEFALREAVEITAHSFRLAERVDDGARDAAAEEGAALADTFD